MKSAAIAVNLKNQGQTTFFSQRTSEKRGLSLILAFEFLSK